MASSSTSGSLEFYPAWWQGCSEHISWSHLGPGEDVEETKTWLRPGLYILIQYRRQWEHLDATKIRFGSKHSPDGDFWCVPLRLMISDVSSLNFPDFCCWLSGPESVTLCSQAGEAGSWIWENHWSFLLCWLWSLVALFGKGASVPSLGQLGYCFPQHGASSGGAGGAGHFRSHWRWEEVLLS